MRSEFKVIEISIAYAESKGNTKVDICRKAELELSTETTFAGIANFQKDFLSVLNSYKHCMKAATYCKVYLSIASYEQAQSPTTLHQTGFDGWKFEGVPSIDDEGLYLSPDVRYTDEQHDIYIAFAEPTLDQLAQSHI